MQVGREIKFRGKRIDNGEWIYGSYSNIPKPNIIFWKRLDDVDEVESYELDCDDVDPETVGQFTGLYDKNGIGIYEGDILKQVYHAERGNPYDGSISFDGHHTGAVVID